MNDIPDFETALEMFRSFLLDNGQPTRVLWVFRDDIWKRPNDVLINYRGTTNNIVLAQKVFTEGREKGLVEIQAVATLVHEVAATIWFPKFPDDEVQGWDSGMKLSFVQPLTRAKRVNPIGWFCFRFLAGFRHYQKEGWTIGTKAWAAA